MSQLNIILAALRASPEVAVLVTDTQGRVTWANAAVVSLTGYTEDELRGLRPGELLQSEHTDRTTINRISRHLAAQVPVSVEIENRRRDGSPYWIRLQIIPAHDASGQLMGFIGLQVDITSDRLQRKALEQARDELLGIFSHEVRTPLNAIANFLDLLNEGPLTPEQAEWLQGAASAADSLLAMVNSVLDYRKAHQMAPRPEPVDLGRLLRQLQAVATGYRRLQEVELRFQLPPDLPVVMIDRDAVFRTLLNLLSNAIKFTAVGHVTVRIERDPRAGDDGRHLLRFSVSDTGIGIAEEDQDRVMKPFEQVDQSISRHFQGTGLGLSLCEQMVKRMGSELKVHSILGVGSCFSFELWGDSASSAVAGGSGSGALSSAPVAGSRPLQGRCLMVVDDNPLGRTVACRQLERLGAQTVAAEDGATCLARLSDLGPGFVDAVLMDLHMPGMGGCDTTRRLHQMPGFERQLVLALSGAVTSMQVQDALQSGMAAFIPKPFNKEELAATLLAHLRPATEPGA